MAEESSEKPDLEFNTRQTRNFTFEPESESEPEPEFGC